MYRFLLLIAKGIIYGNNVVTAGLDKLQSMRSDIRHSGATANKITSSLPGKISVTFCLRISSVPSCKYADSLPRAVDLKGRLLSCQSY